MARLLTFIGVVLALVGGITAFDWWVDPYGDLYKPAALTAAMRAEPDCLVSQELVGARYYPFKLDVFHRRPTRTFVAGSSRVLKIRARSDERAFSNLGYPGTAPETLTALFESLPAKPAQTVYLGVEAFWFNAAGFAVPLHEPTDYDIAKYLLNRGTFEGAYKLVREAPYVLTKRWKREPVGHRCVIGRTFPSIAWNTDGSRAWSWELDPQRFPRFHEPPFTRDLSVWRNGYYGDWTQLDEARLRELGDALALARARGWRVIGFAPPEPARYLELLDTDPRLAPRWHEFLEAMPRLFRRHGFAWAGLWDGSALGCTPRDYPDGFHANAGCSDRVRLALDAVAGR
jgi:hypothetical protein